MPSAQEQLLQARRDDEGHTLVVFLCVCVCECIQVQVAIESDVAGNGSANHAGTCFVSRVILNRASAQYPWSPRWVGFCDMLLTLFKYRWRVNNGWASFLSTSFSTKQKKKKTSELSAHFIQQFRPPFATVSFRATHYWKWNLFTHTHGVWFIFVVCLTV